MLFRIAARLAQFSGGGGGGERLVHVNEGDEGNPLPKFLTEGSDFGSGGAFAAVHADGQAKDDGVNFADRRELDDPFDRIGFSDIDRFDGMGEDSKIIRGGDADAGITVVDPKRGMRGGCAWRVDGAGNG